MEDQKSLSQCSVRLDPGSQISHLRGSVNKVYHWESPQARAAVRLTSPDFSPGIQFHWHPPDGQQGVWGSLCCAAESEGRWPLQALTSLAGSRLTGLSHSLSVSVLDSMCPQWTPDLVQDSMTFYEEVIELGLPTDGVCAVRGDCVCKS